jgi:hypothetical protein
MTFRQHLAKTEIVAITAFVLVAAAFSALGAFRTSLSPGDALTPAAAAAFIFAYTLMIGSLPVIALGAPIYAWLLTVSKASWATALAIGIAPGLALLLIAYDLGLAAIACGTVVALITHAVCRRGSNNSFKPNMLRSSKRRH